ncbi:MAG: GDSL-type esterase/lipase family protein [Actinomycetota bacterium]|nr:GDSL-type esterase/lipase family protein [Actinomycetota bacterium]
MTDTNDFPMPLFLPARAVGRLRQPLLRFDRWWAGHSPASEQWRTLLAVRVALYVAMALLLTATTDSSRWVQWPVCILIVAASFVLGRMFPLSRVLARTPGGWPRAGVIAAGVAIVAAGAGLVGVADGLDIGTGADLVPSVGVFAGYAAIVLGLGVIARALRTLHGGALKWSALIALALSVGGFGLGALLLSSERHLGGAWIIGIAMLLAPFAIALSTEVVVPDEQPTRPPAYLRPLAWLLVGGALMVVSAALLFTVTTVHWRALAWGLPVLALLLLLISIRGDTDVVIVVIALALSWATAPTSVAPGPELHVGPTDEYFAAIGDSYMAGEGAQQYYDGTNVIDENECRRAPTAYSPLLAATEWGVGDELIPEKVVFLACSGAVAHQLWGVAQTDDPVGGPPQLQDDGTYRAGQPQLVQLTNQIARLGTAPKFVLVSIGGNDAGFGKIAQACILPGDCTDLADVWLRPFESGALEAQLGQVYDQIQTTLQYQYAPVIVVPYPNPLRTLGPNDTCSDSLLTDDEVRFLHSFTDQLNAIVARTAIAHGFSVVDPVATAFDDADRQLCDTHDPSDLAVNWLAFGASNGLPQQMINPAHWLHNSMHPTTDGHVLIAKAIAAWIATGELDTLPPMTTLDQPVSFDTVDRTLPSYCTAVAGTFETDNCINRWKFEQMGDALLGLELALLLLFAFGTWLVVCANIAAVRGSGRTPATVAAPEPEAL